MGNKYSNIFSISKTAKQFSNTGQGGIGYDNSRENIDPHIKTKVLSTKEINSQDLIISNLTSGQILFPDTNKEITGSSNLVWDSANKLILKSNETYPFILKSIATDVNLVTMENVSSNGGMLTTYTGGSATNRISSSASYPTFFNNGNVGIGTTDPQTELEVNGTISGSEILSSGLISGQKLSIKTTTNDYLIIDSGGTDIIDIAKIGENAPTGTAIGIRYDGSGTGDDGNSLQAYDYQNSAVRVRISRGGKVGIGIGNAVPLAQLHVLGTTLFAGACTVSGGLLYISGLKKIDGSTPASDGDALKWEATTGRLYGG